MAFTVVFVGLVLIALGVASGFFSVPSVVGSQNSFGNVNGSTSVIESDLIVTNPNPVGARFGGITVKYTVSMNGIAMATGTKDGLSVATGKSTLEFTTLMRNEKIPAWWVSHLRNGETTELRISARVHPTSLGQSGSVHPVGLVGHGDSGPGRGTLGDHAVPAGERSRTQPTHATEGPPRDSLLPLEVAGTLTVDFRDGRTDRGLMAPSVVTDVPLNGSISDEGIHNGSVRRIRIPNIFIIIYCLINNGHR